jgi:4-aminobutyrate aminotransferase-like enzyme
LGYGALNATHREHFRGPFRSQLGEFGHFAPFPVVGQSSCLSRIRWKVIRDKREACTTLELVESRLRSLARSRKIGAVLVEPIQGRGGINIPRAGFLPLLRQFCDEHGALLILDEIYTGFGRTGKWFACEHTGVVPDIVCLGKALTGGFPLSACVGRAAVMDAAWPASSGEAIHTSTFLGHPVGCAMALAQISEIRRLKLCERSAKLGKSLLDHLQRIYSLRFKLHARGVGLMIGLELLLRDGSPATNEAMRLIKAMLHRGFILLPEGEHGNVISFTPPLTISEAQLSETVRELTRLLTADGLR